LPNESRKAAAYPARAISRLSGGETRKGILPRGARALRSARFHRPGITDASSRVTGTLAVLIASISFTTTPIARNSCISLFNLCGAAFRLVPYFVSDRSCPCRRSAPKFPCFPPPHASLHQQNRPKLAPLGGLSVWGLLVVSCVTADRTVVALPRSLARSTSGRNSAPSAIRT